MRLLGWMLGEVLVVAVAACGGGTTSTTDSGSDAPGSLDAVSQETSPGGDVARTDGGNDSIANGDGSSGDTSPADGSTGAVYQYTGYQGTDAMSITFDHGANTFTAVDTTSNVTIAGTLSLLPSGFVALTVTAGCTGTGCMPGTTGTLPAPIGTVFNAIEAPGYFVVSGPGMSGGSTVVAVATNDCGSGTFATYNAVQAGLPSTYNLTTDSAYETATLSGTPSAVAVSIMAFSLNGTALSAPTIPTGTCTQGVTTILNSSGNSVTLYSSGNGVIVANGGAGSASTFGLQQSAIALTNIENHNYSGYGFSYGPNGGVQPVSVVFGSSATGVATPFTDVNTNTLDPTDGSMSSVTFTTDSNGLLTGTVTNQAGPGQVAAAAFMAGSTTILAIIGSGSSSSDGGVGNAFNAIVVSH